MFQKRVSDRLSGRGHILLDFVDVYHQKAHLLCYKERIMPKMLSHRFQGTLVCLAGLLLMMLVTACSSVAGTNTGQTGSTGTTSTVAATTQTQVTPTATQAAVATPTQPPVAFKAGGISFIGPAKSVNSSSIVMSAPNGQTFTLKITPQTDLSGYGGSLPAVGSSVDMDSTANPDGSYSATILKPARPGD